jgi:squalene-associated FAD-dependent desaturase
MAIHEEPDSNAARLDVAIIGGGLAGVAAALELRDLAPQARIALFESRKRLGGRAGSFVDPKSGAWVDNCQHVGLGCCDELVSFVRKLGAPDAFRRVASLKFRTPDGRSSAISAFPLLPAPLHLGFSFARLHFLSLRDKAMLAFGLLKLAATPPARLRGRSVAEWLIRNRQTNRTIARFWEPVLVSALNDSLDELDVAGARQVFVESFFRRRDGYHLLVPSMPLGELFDSKVRVALEQANIELQSNMACRGFEILGDGSFRLHFRDGSSQIARKLILAVPWAAAAELAKTANQPELAPVVDHAERLKPSPITGIHLILDRRICDESEVALLDTTAQWVFDHTEADRRQNPEMVPAGGQSLHVVVSASHELAEKSREEILAIISNDLQRMFPAMVGANVISSWVVTEHAATFSPAPGTEAFRPQSTTPIPGLFLAGDWTDTGWPATMEGAIRSGISAAKAATERP